GQGLSVGQSAPDFGDGQDGAPFLDLDDKPISMADFKGRPLWVAFWATWCPPCQQETPDLRATYEAHRNEGLQVLAVDVQEPPEAAREYARAYGLTYKIGVDATATVMKRYGVFGLPTHYFIDTDGIVRDRYFGPLTRDEMERRVALIGLKPPTWSDPP
ncbi:MAG: TlpA family protein disulfide reductase, partial [Candidatus Limnocylindria bacterium]